MIAALLIEGGNISRHCKGRLWVNAVGGLRELHLVRTERCAVRLLAPRLVRRTKADDGSHCDEAWSLIGNRPINGAIDRLDVVAILNASGVPAVRVKTLEHIFGPGGRGWPIELNKVVVPEVDQLAELQVPRERRGLRGDPLLKIAIRDDGEDAVVNDGVSWAVELLGEAALCDRHTNAVREPLAEWAGGGLDAGGQAELWVPRGQ